MFSLPAEFHCKNKFHFVIDCPNYEKLREPAIKSIQNESKKNIIKENCSRMDRFDRYTY